MIFRFISKFYSGNTLDEFGPVLQFIAIILWIILHSLIHDVGFLEITYEFYTAIIDSFEVNIASGIIALLILLSFYLIIVFMFISAFIFFTAHIYDFFRKLSNKSINVRTLFACYIEIALFFSYVYFVLIYTKFVDIENVHKIKESSFYKGAEVSSAYDSFYSYFDCLHFSIVTQTTLGYGNMFPKDFLGKILVNAQVLIGIYFIVIAVGLKISRKD